MADPRLNSIHLESPRRQEFRRARQELLNACGSHTVYVEKRQATSDSFVNNTFIQNGPDAPAQPDAEYWLIDREFVYPLKVGVNTVGRSPDNDVVIPDAYVSRRHCAILVHASRSAELFDVASKNGTFLNGSKVPGPTVLRSGDEIRMCDREFVFMSKAERDAHPGRAATLSE